MNGRLRDDRRFWDKVLVGDGCWEWQASKKPGEGYGQFKFFGQMVRAHRVAWELTRGPVPVGSWVLHHCDNPPCVRPDHLYLGDREKNINDMVERERAWWITASLCGNGLHPSPGPGVRCPACRQAKQRRQTDRRRQKRAALAVST